MYAERTMITDVHAHYVPMSLLDKGYDDILRIEKEGENWQIRINEHITTPITKGMLDLKIQLEEMKAVGVERRFLSIAPIHFAYESDKVKKFAVDFNNCMAEEVEDYSDNFKLLATLPFPDVDEATAEMTRVMSNPKFAGVEIASNIIGMELGDKALIPFWKKAEELNAFVLIHPHYCVDDIRINKNYLSNYVGNPLETTLAAFHLIAGEVLELFPDLKICLSHGGGYLGLAMSRFDHGFQVRNELKHLKHKPSYYGKKMYIDTIQHSKDSLEFVISSFGVDHVLMGTDYPFDMGMLNPIEAVNELDLNEKDKNLIKSYNIEKIEKQVFTKV